MAEVVGALKTHTREPPLVDPTDLRVGDEVLVFWGRFDSWYPATIRSIHQPSERATFEYFDGFAETIKFTHVCHWNSDASGY
jgi:hypothetical protein